MCEINGCHKPDSVKGENGCFCTDHEHLALVTVTCDFDGCNEQFQIPLIRAMYKRLLNGCSKHPLVFVAKCGDNAFARGYEDRYTPESD